MNWRIKHRYVALAITLPLLIVVGTGLLLQWRNQLEWVQPKTVATTLQSEAPLLTLEAVSKLVNGEIEQIIYRPGKGNISVRLKDTQEVQLHPQTGEVLKVAIRRSGWLIDIHQGSWMGPFGMYVVHFGAALGLIFLVISGFIIWPFWRLR